MVEKARNVIRETDADAIRLAKTLLASARHGALAVHIGKTGFPGASRVALATDVDGTPVILVSSLSWHTTALLSDPRCSVLVGEPGKGDPLAHARMTVFCRAETVVRDSDEGRRIRRRYLARHPKSALYADFGDFSFIRLRIDNASLNGGFGKAYELRADDILRLGDIEGLSEIEESAVAHMNADHADAVTVYAEAFAKVGPGNWRVATLDTEGMDLIDGDRICRVWYRHVLHSAGDLRQELADMANEARSTAKGTQ